MEIPEQFARQFSALSAMLQALLMHATIIERAELHLELRRPERFSLYIPTTSAYLPQMFTGSTVYPTTRCIMFVHHARTPRSFLYTFNAKREGPVRQGVCTARCTFVQYHPDVSTPSMR